ncbi:unnamed protein product [Rotaria sp. Silwood1]|nr:unnamed protein product [Rotaria sp. Silwood1]
MTRILLFIEFFTLIFTVINGTHFHGGTITWHPLNSSDTGSPVAIVITQTYLWTWSVALCTSSNIASSASISFTHYYPSTSSHLDCALNCATATGYVAPPILPDCTDASSAQDTTAGQRSDIVYVPRNADFTVAFASSAWRSLATNSAADWSIASRIELTPRSDNGLYNNAPIATVMSPIYIPQHQPTAIHIPIGDADGDIMRCRWSSGTTECGHVCPPGSLPSGTLIFSNCTIIITGTNIGDWFAVTVMVEDFISSSSTTPLSSVPVQFLVHVVAPSSCSTPPEVYELSNKSCIPITVGHTFTSHLIAINNCGSSVSIIDISTLSFAGMVQSSIIQQDSMTYYKTLSWIPTTSQLGYQVMCAMALDSQNSQSAQYCFKFYVSQSGVSNCPGDPIVTSTTTTTTTTTTTSSSTTTSSTISTTSTSTSTTSSIPTSWVIYEENGPFELYHIDRCTDRECQWTCASIPSNSILSNNAKKYLVDGLFNENSKKSTNDDIKLFKLLTPTTSCSSEDKNHLSMIDVHAKNFLSMNNNNTRLKPVGFNHVSVTKVKKVNKMHSILNLGIQSPIRRFDENADSSVQRPINGATVQVSRIKSSTKKRLDTLKNKSVQQHETNSVVDSMNVIRVTHVPSRLTEVDSISVQIDRPPIIENTSRLDENVKTRTSIGLLKKNKDKIHVKPIRSTHRTSVYEHRPSQIETIKLFSLNSVSEHKTTSQLSSVRVERIQREKIKLKLARNIVSFESISRPTGNEKKDQDKRNIKFGVAVERISREKSTESIK